MASGGVPPGAPSESLAASRAERAGEAEAAGAKGLKQRPQRASSPAGPRSAVAGAQAENGKARSAVPAAPEAPPRERWPNFPGVARMSLGFFTVFTSFNTTQNMMPFLLQELGFGRLGFVSLMVLYIFFLLSCAPIPPLLKRVSARQALPVASWPYMLFSGSAGLVASGVIQSSTAQAMLLLASLLLGIGGAGLWCCQGVIMTYYAPPRLLNRYIAFFLVCWQAGPLCGASLARFLLERTTTAKALLVLSLISCVGSAMLAGLPAPEQGAGTPPEPPVAAQGPLRELRGEMLQRLRQPLALLHADGRAARIAVLSFAHGAGLNAFPSAVFSRCAAAGHEAAAAAVAGGSADAVRRAVAVAFQCSGVGSVLAAVCFAPMADRLGRRTSLVCVSLLILASALCFELQLLGAEPMSRALSYLNLAAFGLGLANVCCRGSLLSSISSLYKSESVYAVVAMQLGTSAGSIFGFACFPALPLQACLAAGLLGYAACALAASLHAPLFDEGPATKGQ